MNADRAITEPAPHPEPPSLTGPPPTPPKRSRRKTPTLEPQRHEEPPPHTTAPEEEEPPPQGLADQYAYALVDFASPEFWTKSDTGDWLVEPFLPAGRQIAIVAEAKAGKSLLSLDIAAAVATGRPVLSQPAGEPRDVLYCDMEMSREDLRDRLEDLGYGPQDDLSKLIYYSLPSFPAFDTRAGGEVLEELVAEHGVELVIIDTTSRVIEGDENDARTFQNLFHHLGKRMKARGVTLVRLDHLGKNKESGARGSSAKNADVDLVWELTATDDGVKLRRTHQRINFAPESITLRRDDSPLRHRVVEGSWPAGTADLARILDQLNVSPSASISEANEALRASGNGRRKELVGAAQRFRRSTIQMGTGAGTADQKPRNTSPEPLPEPAGTADDSNREDICEPATDGSVEMVRNTPGTAPGTAPSEATGTGAGTADQKPRNTSPEPLPEPAGTAPPSTWERFPPSIEGGSVTTPARKTKSRLLGEHPPDPWTKPPAETPGLIPDLADLF